MTDFVIFLILVFLGVFAVVHNRYFGSKRPKFIRDLENMAWEFESGGEILVGPGGKSRGRPVIQTEYLGERTLRIGLDYEKRRRRNDEIERIHHLVGTVKLSAPWDDIRLRRRGIKRVGENLKSAEVPIGDAGFDEEFILTGSVDESVREHLCQPDVQQAFRQIEDKFWVESGWLHIRRRMGKQRQNTRSSPVTAMDVLDFADELVELARCVDGELEDQTANDSEELPEMYREVENKKAEFQ